jgi:hypothetical protein
MVSGRQAQAQSKLLFAAPHLLHSKLSSLHSNQFQQTIQDKRSCVSERWRWLTAIDANFKVKTHFVNFTHSRRSFIRMSRFSFCFC